MSFGARPGLRMLEYKDSGDKSFARNALILRPNALVVNRFLRRYR